MARKTLAAHKSAEKSKRRAQDDHDEDLEDEDREEDLESDDDEEMANDDRDEDMDKENRDEDMEDDDGKEASALKRARAIMDLPEAEGRSGLARELATTPGMSKARAKRLLAAAPKSNSLYDAHACAGGNPSIDGSGGHRPQKSGSSALADSMDRLLAKKGLTSA